MRGESAIVIVLALLFVPFMWLHQLGELSYW